MAVAATIPTNNPIPTRTPSIPSIAVFISSDTLIRDHENNNNEPVIKTVPAANATYAPIPAVTKLPNAATPAANTAKATKAPAAYPKSPLSINSFICSAAYVREKENKNNAPDIRTVPNPNPIYACILFFVIWPNDATAAAKTINAANPFLADL